MIITNQTTLAELAIIRARLGITSTTLMRSGRLYLAGLRGESIDSTGFGNTEAEALNRALEDFSTQLAARYSKESAR